MIDAGLVLRGRYEILARLRAGGMGEVYRGMDRESGQLVAVKRLLLEQEKADRALLERRFEEERKVLQRLNFRGIPGFVDAFLEDGHSYLVMEYVQGFSLDTLLEFSRSHNQSGLSAEQVAALALQVSQVLEYLHSFQPPLVHRDIKPSNLIIRESDEWCFLVDFGLAREVRSQSSAKTQVGTWCYAPLEQIRGKAEPRSDFYSLGVTMLELLSGECPAALNVPPARSLIPNLNVDFARIIDLCTRAEVSERYSEACLLRMDLERVLPQLKQGVAPEAPDQENQEDKVSELVRRWGRGRHASLPAPADSDSPRLEPVVPVGAQPQVRRAVDRARRRLQPSRTRLWLSLSLFLVLALGLPGMWAWHYRKTQAEALSASFLGEGPGPGWRLVDAYGLKGGALLALGEGPPDLRFPPSGFLYQRMEAAAPQELSFQVSDFQGAPRLLAFAGGFGIHLHAKGRHHQVEVVRLVAASQLAWPAFNRLGASHPLTELRSLSLSLVRGFLVLKVGGKELERVPLPARLKWEALQCGLLLDGARPDTQLSLSRFSLR